MLKNVFIIFLAVLSFEAHAVGPSSFVFQGQILRPDTTPLEAASVDFTVQILSTTNGCLLHEETFNENMTGSDGVFNLSLGTGSNTGAGGMYKLIFQMQ